MVHLLACIRAADKAPIHWHTSDGWGINKKNGKPAMKSIRYVHGMPQFGKTYTRYMFEQTAFAPPPSYAYGCVRGRRREAAILDQLLMRKRLKVNRVSHASKFYDAANAFSSVDHQFMMGVVEGAFDIPAWQRITEDHLLLACCRILVQGVIAYLLPGSGVLPGSSPACDLFNHSFWLALAPVLAKVQHLDPLLIGTSPIDASQRYTALTVLVDDVAHLFTLLGIDDLEIKRHVFTRLITEGARNCWHTS